MKQKRIIIGIILLVVIVVAIVFGKSIIETKNTEKFLKVSIENSEYQIGKSKVSDFLKNGWEIKNKMINSIPKKTNGTISLIKNDKVIIVIWENKNSKTINEALVSGICIDKAINLDYKLSSECEAMYNDLHKQLQNSSGSAKDGMFVKNNYYKAFLSISYDKNEIVTLGYGDISIGVSKQSFE